MSPPTQAEVALVVHADGTVQSTLRCSPQESGVADSHTRPPHKRKQPRHVVLAGLPTFLSLLPTTLVKQGASLSPSHPLLLNSRTSALTRLLPFTSVDPPLSADVLLPSGDYAFSTPSQLTHAGMYDLGELSLPATVTYAATGARPAVVYSGNIDAVSLSGAGEVRWPASDAEYEGDVQGGKRHGQGKLSLPHVGAAYTGHFRDGLRHGHGKVAYDAHGRQYYVGGWQDGVRHGQGVMRYASGNTYDGQWAHNRKHGSGTMRWHTAHLAYSGEWADDRPDGQGCYKWTSSGRLSLHHPLYNTYRGEVSGGERHGPGSFLYADGGEWHGEWQGGKKHGGGVWVWANGSEMSGEWRDDELQGDEARRTWAERDTQHLDLQLTDLLAALPGDSAADELSRVRVLLQRYDGLMRAVYKQFASVDASQQWRGKEGFGVRLNLQQLYCCLRHFDLLDTADTAQQLDATASEEKVERGRVQRADVDRLLFRRYGQSEPVQRRRAVEWHSMHDSRHALLYREFAEVLVRLSPLVYSAQPSLSDCVERLLSSLAARRGHALLAPLFSQHPALAAVALEHDATVSSLFAAIALPSALSLAMPNRFTDVTATSTDLLTLLTSPACASRLFSAHFTPRHLAQLLPASPCVELVEHEVCCVLLRVAVYRWQVEADKARLRGERFAARLDRERRRAVDKQRRREEAEAETKRVADEQQALLAAEEAAAKEKGGKGKGKPAAAAAAARRPASKQSKAKPGKKGAKGEEEEEKSAEQLAAEAREEQERREEVGELVELLLEGVDEEEAEREAVYPLCWADRASGEVEQELGAERMAQLLQFVGHLLASLRAD